MRDSRGRVIQTTDPRGHRSYVRYLTAGFQNADSTYGEGSTPSMVKGTVFYYDTYGRQVASRDAMNRPLTLTVDGSTRSFFYDPMGRWSGAVRGTSIDTIKTDLAGRPSTAVTVRNGRVYTQHLGYSAETSACPTSSCMVATTRRPAGATTSRAGSTR